MRFQRLALFCGIGLDACTVNLGSRMPSPRLAPGRLWPFPCDHHTVRIEARDIRIQEGHETNLGDGSVARQVLEQFFELIFISSDSVHDAVLCAERRGRTPARSIDAAIIKDPTYGRDY
jgi:hypothetical protein